MLVVNSTWIVVAFCEGSELIYILIYYTGSLG